MSILITGADGFVGLYMVEFLLKKGIKVYGTTWSGINKKALQELDNQVHLIECDIRNSTAVDDLIQKSSPDRIIHLAAQTFVPVSWKNPAETIMINMIGTYNLLGAVERFKKEARVLVICAANQYGHVAPDEIPIKETTPFRPDNPYAVSKIGVDMIAYQYFISHKLDTIRIRPFSHTGPKQDTRFVCSDFAKQIAEIEKGKKEPVMYVGNLEAVRDFLDVRDVVKGYWLALEKGVSGEVYNICSGIGFSIQEILDQLLEQSQVNIEIRRDPNRMRPSDVPIIVGDNSKFRQATGWTPQIPMDQTLRDILDYWRGM